MPASARTPDRPVRAHHTPEPAAIVTDARLPRDLAEAVSAATRVLRERGLDVSDRVVLDAPARARWDVLAYLLAADRAGAASR